MPSGGTHGSEDCKQAGPPDKIDVPYLLVRCVVPSSPVPVSRSPLPSALRGMPRGRKRRLEAELEAFLTTRRALLLDVEARSSLLWKARRPVGRPPCSPVGMSVKEVGAGRPGAPASPVERSAPYAAH